MLMLDVILMQAHGTPALHLGTALCNLILNLSSTCTLLHLRFPVVYFYLTKLSDEFSEDKAGGHRGRHT